MDELTLVYLAGCMDSDGYFTIRVDTYQMRIGQAKSPQYQEQIGLRQVTPIVPELLKSCFGGNVYITKGGTPRSKPLHSWHINSAKAASAVQSLLPYLRIKKDQAEILLELRADKDAVSQTRKENGSFAVNSEELTNRREVLRQRIKAMNLIGLPE